jgi:hypothetical protein
MGQPHRNAHREWRSESRPRLRGVSPDCGGSVAPPSRRHLAGRPAPQRFAPRTGRGCRRYGKRIGRRAHPRPRPLGRRLLAPGRPNGRRGDPYEDPRFRLGNKLRDPSSSRRAGLLIGSRPIPPSSLDHAPLLYHTETPHQSLQPGFLRVELLLLAHLVDIQVRALLLPAVKGLFQNPHFADQLRHGAGHSAGN